MTAKIYFKDHFSQQAETYRQFRPHYPPALYKFLAEICPMRKLAWDCGTGNGQAAIGLTPYFSNIIATDASEKQIAQAIQHPQVIYRVAPAEKSLIPSNKVNLIVVAQALHWFDLNQFYIEAQRVLCFDGIIAVWSYNLFKISSQINKIIENFYNNTVGRFWPPERKWVEQNYQNIPFPFRQIPVPSFNMEATWSLEQLIGYINTWSAVQRYQNELKQNPVDLITQELSNAWGSMKRKRKIQWPLVIKVGRVIHR